MIRTAIILLFLFASTQIWGDDKPIYVLTKERTGTSWTLFTTQALTQKPLYSQDGLHEIEQRDPLAVDYTLKPICRCHAPKRMPENLGQKEGVLLVTLRDYHEALFRGPPDQTYTTLSELIHELERYVAIIEYFDSFPESRRKIISYEDLVLDPISEITSLFHFLQQHSLIHDETSLVRFINKYEEYRTYMINQYNGDWKSYTKGQHIPNHKKKCTKRVALQIQYYLQCKHPIIWAKYFSRYRISEHNLLYFDSK